MEAIIHKRGLLIATMILFAACLAAIGTFGDDAVWASSPSRQAVVIDASKHGEIVAAHCQIGNLTPRSARLAKIEFVPRVWLTLWLKEWETSPNWTERDIYCYIGNLRTQAVEDFDVANIDPRSILLNRRVPISDGSNQILPQYPGFAGPVLRVGFNKREALLSLGIEGQGSSSRYQLYRVTVKGQMSGTERWFYGFTFIKVEGEEPAKLPDTTSETERQTPDAFGLFENYPNPFNPETQISYSLPRDLHVTLIVFNILGQKVKTLVDEFQYAGHNSVRWDSRDDDGREVSSGIYFYRIQAGEYGGTKRMVLLK